VQRFRNESDMTVIIELTEPIADRASRLVHRHRLRAADAIQLASSLALRDEIGDMAPVFFLTFDQALDQAARAEGLTPPPLLAS